MQIKFYKVTDDKRVIDKTLGTAKTKSSCQLIEPSSVINPSFTIDIDTSIYSYNYVYIAYFGRYYYINDITVIDGARMLVTCNVDVLKSFATPIKSCTVNTRRNENNYDMYLPDDRPVELPLDITATIPDRLLSPCKYLTEPKFGSVFSRQLHLLNSMDIILFRRGV